MWIMKCFGTFVVSDLNWGFVTPPSHIFTCQEGESITKPWWSEDSKEKKEAKLVGLEVREEWSI